MWIKKVKERQFEEAYQLIGKMSDENFSVIQNKAFTEEDIVYYEFFKFIIDNYDSSGRIHYLASELLSTALNIFPGSYSTAFYHAKEAIKKQPDDYSLLEYLLFFIKFLIDFYPRKKPKKLLKRFY